MAVFLECIRGFVIGLVALYAASSTRMFGSSLATEVVS